MRCSKCGCKKGPNYRRNISDEDLEYLKQQMELGDAGALQQLIDEGELDPRYVALAAYLGDPLALQVSEPWDESNVPRGYINQVGGHWPKIRIVLRFGELDKRLLVSCAADLAEHVLHIFEEDFPNDDRPRLAIKTTRDWVNGLITDNTTKDAADAAAEAAYAAANANTLASLDAAWAAIHAADAYTAWTAAVAWTSYYAANDAADSAASAVDAAENKELEIAWQTQRLIDYLLGRIN